jgi:hypothetical protein
MRNSSIASSFLLILASLYFLFSGVSFLISPVEMIRLLLSLWLFILLFSFPAFWLTKDWNWAGILLIVFILGFLSRPIFAYAYSTTVLVILLLLWVTFRLLFKRKLTFRHVYFVINLISFVAIILTSTVTVSRFKTIPSSYYRNIRDVIASKKFVELDGTRNKPDIYFIVLDGYGRSDILKNYYGFDNSPFISTLKEKGFIVPAEARSNYPKTVISVTSTLNMDYVDQFAPQLQNSILWWLMSPWLDHNLVRTSLERIGYSSVSISTDWSITDNPTSDYYFKSHPIVLSDFERYFFSATPAKMFQPLLEKFASAPTYNAHRRSQINNFEALRRLNTLPGPKFVFAHIILPHPPFVFSKDGSPRNPRYAFSFNDASDYPESLKEYRREYVEQAEFLNSQLEPLIDSMLKNSKAPPIIILQADHGPGMLTDFASADNTCLPERFSPFSAYYLPGLDPQKIPEDITPVNLFRIIFDNYFDANLPMLENKQYYPRQAISVYDLENVTSLVDLGQNCSPK